VLRVKEGVKERVKALRKRLKVKEGVKGV